jgi:hypothetical protein
MQHDRSRWFMHGPADTPRLTPFDSGSVWRFRYSLTGAAMGAPRRVGAWSGGRSFRASDGKTLFIDGPGGLAIIGSDGEVTQTVLPGRTDVYTPPFPELEGLRSLPDACGWLDRPLPTDAPLPGEFLGRRVWLARGENLEVALDQESGFVVRVGSIGFRGKMLLEVEECGWVPQDQDLFTWDRRREGG